MVIKPLFEAFGYENVQFFGGPGERGKDLVAWKENDFRDKELTAIQVKKVASSRRAADPNSYPGLLPQLMQLADNPVPLVDGTERRPDRRYFITPSRISARVLEENIESHRALQGRGVTVIDGEKLAESVAHHLPERAWALLGTKTILGDLSQSSHLEEEPLLRALDASDGRDISDIYTNLTYTVGGATVWEALSCDHYAQKHDEYNIPLERWNELYELAQLLNKQGVDVFNARCSEYLSLFKKTRDEELRIEKSRVNKLKARKLQLEKTLEKRQSLETAIDKCTSEIAARERKKIASLKSRKHRLEKRISTLKKQSKKTPKGGEPAEIEGGSSTLDRKLKQELALLNEDIEIIFAEVQPLRAEQAYIDEEICELRSSLEALTHPTRLKLRVELDNQAIAGFLNEQRATISEEIKIISKGKPSAKQIRTFIQNIKYIFDILQKLQNSPELGVVSYETRSEEFFQLNIGIPVGVEINLIFDTRMNFIVLGEAGAGKTTTLRMHEKRRSDRRHVLFVPLAKLVDTWGDLRQQCNEKSKIPKLEDGVQSFASTQGAPGDFIRESFLKAREATLLLDGIDEILYMAPWITRSVTSFITRFPAVQVIASSRTLGANLEGLGLFPISLRPFTDKQVFSFFRRWFREKRSAANRVIKYLSNNRELLNVVGNPLMATVLCVLQECKIELPENEAMLCEERMKLLVGDYDIHKGVPKRTKSRRNDLWEASIFLGYRLHQAGRRGAEADELVKWLQLDLGKRLGMSRCEKSLSYTMGNGFRRKARVWASEISGVSRCQRASSESIY